MGEGIQATGNEDAEAYICQKVGVHVNPFIAVYADPDDCERKEQIVEIERCTEELFPVSNSNPAVKQCPDNRIPYKRRYGRLSVHLLGNASKVFPYANDNPSL